MTYSIFDNNTHFQYISVLLYLQKYLICSPFLPPLCPKQDRLKVNVTHRTQSKKCCVIKKVKKLPAQGICGIAPFILGYCLGGWAGTLVCSKYEFEESFFPKISKSLYLIVQWHLVTGAGSNLRKFHQKNKTKSLAVPIGCGSG